MMRHSFALRWYSVGRLLYERQVAHLNAEEVRDFRAQFGDTWYLVKTLLGRLHERGRTCFGEVSLADLDDYAAHVKATETSHGQREDRLSIVNRVWSYRDLLPEADRLPQTPPWRGERIQDILQQRRAGQPQQPRRFRRDGAARH